MQLISILRTCKLPYTVLTKLFLFFFSSLENVANESKNTSPSLNGGTCEYSVEHKTVLSAWIGK